MAAYPNAITNRGYQAETSSQKNNSKSRVITVNGVTQRISGDAVVETRSDGTQIINLTPKYKSSQKTSSGGQAQIITPIGEGGERGTSSVYDVTDISKPKYVGDLNKPIPVNATNTKIIQNNNAYSITYKEQQSKILTSKTTNTLSNTQNSFNDRTSQVLLGKIGLSNNQLGQEIKGFGGYDLRKQYIPRTQLFSETISSGSGNNLINVDPMGTAIYSSQSKVYNRQAELGLSQAELRSTGDIRNFPKIFKQDIELGALSLAPAAVGVLYSVSPVDQQGKFQIPLITPTYSFIKNIRSSDDALKSNPYMVEAQAAPTLFFGSLLGVGIGKGVNAVKSTEYGNALLSSGDKAGFVRRTETFLNYDFYGKQQFPELRGNTPFVLDTSAGFRAKTLSTVTGENYVAQSTIYGESTISKPTTPGFLSREGIKLTSQYGQDLIMPTGQSKLFDNSIINFPRGRTESPNILLSPKSIEGTNPTFKVFDFINPERNFFSTETRQQTLFPLDKPVINTRNSLMEIYGKKTVLSTETLPKIDTIKVFDLESPKTSTTTIAVKKTETSAYDMISLRSQPRFKLQFLEEEYVQLPKVKTGESIFSFKFPTYNVLNLNTQQSKNVLPKYLQTQSKNSLLMNTQSSSKKNDIISMQNLLSIQSPKIIQNTRSAQLQSPILAQLQKQDLLQETKLLNVQIPKTISRTSTYKDYVFDYGIPPSKNSFFFSNTYKKSKKSKFKTFRGGLFGKVSGRSSNVFILPDLASVNKTESTNFFRFGGGEAIAPKATKRVKGLSYAAFTGQSSGFVPTEQMRRNNKLFK